MELRQQSRVWASVLAVLLPLGAAMQAQQPVAVPQNGADLKHDSDPVPSPDPDKKIISSAPQQTQAPSTSAGQITEENGEYTLKTTAYEVRLNASVVDSRGVPVDSLPKTAFQVYEDGVPQTILGFRHEDLPVSLGIVIDSSGSMYDKRAAVDAASIDLVRLSNPKDEAFLVDFSSEPYLDQDFTSDVAMLQKGLAYVKSSGGTALYDAVVASADQLVKGAKNSKQVLLTVTDGDDNASTNATLEAAIRRVQNLDGPVIYCIGLLFGDDVTRGEAKHSRQVLTELANQTGGAAYFPRSLKEVDDIAKDVAADIRTQYTISYRSTNPPSNGGYRQVHVEAKEKGFRNLTVRTRAGYFPKVAKSTTK